MMVWAFFAATFSFLGDQSFICAISRAGPVFRQSHRMEDRAVLARLDTEFEIDPNKL